MPAFPLVTLLGALAPAALSLPQTPFGEPTVVAGTVGRPDVTKIFDVDGDGALDIVTASRSSHRIRVARGRTGQYAGTFSAPEVFLTVADLGAPETPRVASFDVANMDSDADMEICVLRSSGAVEVYDRTSGSTYVLSATVATLPASDYAALRMVDFDGDGWLDATSIPSVAVEGAFWAKGLGGGQFAVSAPLLGGSATASGAVLLDADGDGDQDLAVQFEVIGPVTVPLAIHRNDGQLPMDPVAGIPIPVGPLGDSIPTFAVAADADLDGLPDLITGGPYSADIQVHLGAALLSGASTAVVPFGFTPLRGTVGDFDGDGVPDLAASSYASPVLEWARGLGPGAGWGQGGTFGTPRGLVAGLESADLNGSGRSDLVRFGVDSAAIVSGEIDVFLATGPAAAPFDAGTKIGESHGKTLLLAGDVDQDGLADLIVQDRAGTNTYVKAGRGDGTFGPRQGIPTTFQHPVLGDVTGDGAADLLSYEIRFGPGPTVERLVMSRNRGDGTFEDPVVAVPMPTPSMASSTWNLRVHDVDGDGDLDVAFLANAGIWPVVALNQGDGTFDPPQLFTGSTGAGSARFEFGDLNGDGVQDFVMSYDQYLAVASGTGGGQFAARTEILTGGVFAEDVLDLADIDGDGWTDILFQAFVAGPRRSIWWVQNLAGAGFSAPRLVTDIPLGIEPIGAETADFDLDGDRDVTVDLSFFGQAAFHYVENLGGGSFGPLVDVPLLESDQSNMTVVDLDGDGDDDVILTIEDIAKGTAIDLDVVLNTTRGAVGDRYCGGTTPNSSGLPGKLDVLGSDVLGDDALVLVASNLPGSVLGFFLTSRTADLVPEPPGSVGTLCLGGAIGRFVGPGQTLNSGSLGSFRLGVDALAIPDPALGLISAQVGETWRFQAWHRDTVAGAPTSNFTDSVAVTFL